MMFVLVFLITVVGRAVNADISLPFNCLTTNDQPCSFPFRHSGKVSNECVKLKAGSQGLHCPVSVHPVTLQVEQWGKCQEDSCVIACATVKGVRCQFPFKFDSSSRLEGRCARKAGGFQCATKVDDVTRLGKEFDDCLPEACPLD